MKTVDLIGVSVQLRRACALRDVTLAAAEGERIAIFGPGGAGKTTLLRLVAGRAEPTAGAVRVLERTPRWAKAKLGIALEPATSSLFTPSQVIAKSLAAHDVPGYQRAAKATEALEILGLFDERDRPLREMGATARVSVRLAAAIAHRPAVLLVDNMTACLPEPIARRFWRHVDDLRSVEGLTVLHATTSSAEAAAAERVVMMDGGTVVADASPQTLQAAHGETLVIEAADAETVKRTLRGLYEVVLEETDRGLIVSVPDAVPAVAHLFRHPVAGFRSVFIRQADMWEIHRRLAEARSS